MNSRLYECQVRHARFIPEAHRFVYRLFFFALDLDELDNLDRKLRFFSLNRRNLYSFRDADFLPAQGAASNQRSEKYARAERPFAGLKSRLTAHLGDHGIDLTGGRVILVTVPRVLGYLFNPVSFYFCYDCSGTPVAALAEVTNTFREMKIFVLGPGTRAGDTFRLRVPKHFYVSPFSDVDVAFDFTLRVPAARLSIQIDDYIGAERTLTSTLSGRGEPLTDARLAWFTLKYPLITLRTITLIHWQAFRLWLKRVPWFAKSARAADQRDFYRPRPPSTAGAQDATAISSASLTPSPKA